MSREELNEWIGADAEATNKMTGRDITFIKRLIKWITELSTTAFTRWQETRRDTDRHLLAF